MIAIMETNFLTVIGKAYVANIDSIRKSMGMSASNIDYIENESNGTIIFSVPEKIIAEDKGRRAFVQKVPIQSLINWMKKAGISTDNNLVYAIRESIYQNGIKAKNFLEKSKDQANESANVILSMNFSELLNSKIKSI